MIGIVIKGMRDARAVSIKPHRMPELSVFTVREDLKGQKEDRVLVRSGVSRAGHSGQRGPQGHFIVVITQVKLDQKYHLQERQVLVQCTCHK